MILALFLSKFRFFSRGFPLIFGNHKCQDQVQHFNARAEEYHRRHGDETSPFQACLLGTAQRDETIIKNAVGGEYCGSTTSCGLFSKMQRGSGLYCIGPFGLHLHQYKATLIVRFQSRGKPAPMLTEGCFPFVRGRA